VSGRPDRLRVCFLSGSRLAQPLGATNQKKFEAISRSCEPIVVAFSADGQRRTFVEDGVGLYLLGSRGRTRRAAAMAIGRPLLALWLVLRRGVRVFVSQSPYEAVAATTVKRICGLVGVRIVSIVESHGDFEHALFLQHRIRWERLVRGTLGIAARWTLRHADLLRAISDATKVQLVSHAPRTPLVQFMTWTDASPFFASEGSGARRDVLYAGVLTRLKGVHWLVAAFAAIADRAPNACLLLVGHPEDPRYADELRAECERRGISARVRFVGAVPQATLARLMTDAAVLVLPSTSEGLGRVLVEAMACATPVVASAVGGIPEIVREGQSGFLIPVGDVDKLADRIARVLDHPAEARAMGEAGRRFALGFFSTERYAMGYRRLFELAESLLDPESPVDSRAARMASR